jgi:aminopeptidase
MLATAGKRRIGGVDPRIEAYAKLLVERSLDVQPGWQVWINSSALGRPLVEEVVRLIARRGAYPLVRIGGAAMEDVPFETLWALEAPEELLAEVAPADRHAWETMDAWMNIGAPENTAAGLDLSAERRALLAKARHAMRTRRLSDEIPWVACRFPTPALAQDSRMSLAEFEDFLYGACLRDWDAEAERMAKIKERFDRASEVRIVGAGTDLALSLEGREGEIDAGHSNMPGGEVYYCPVEDATQGVVDFSEFPAYQEPDELEGVRMVYEGGRVVEASATRGEDVLFETLDRDEGARVLGELGIGCNPGIQRYMKNTLFDEKIDGTVHLAIGAGFPTLGGKNTSVVHWDMVKDLRPGGQLLCDGEVVQENGRWLL